MEGDASRTVVAFGRRSCFCFNVAGWIFLLAGVGGSRTRRWGLLGEGARLTWREVSEI